MEANGQERRSLRPLCQFPSKPSLCSCSRNMHPASFGNQLSYRLHPLTTDNLYHNKNSMPAINWKHFALSAVACLLITGIIIAATWSTPRIESIEKVEFVNIADSFVNLRMTCRVNNANFYTISGKN